VGGGEGGGTPALGQFTSRFTVEAGAGPHRTKCPGSSIEADGHSGSDSESSGSFDFRDGYVDALVHGARSVQNGAEALGQALPPQADAEVKTEDRDSLSPF
jgi:hypothetical protein